MVMYFEICTLQIYLFLRLDQILFCHTVSRVRSTCCILTQVHLLRFVLFWCCLFYSFFCTLERGALWHTLQKFCASNKPLKYCWYPPPQHCYIRDCYRLKGFVHIFTPGHPFSLLHAHRIEPEIVRLIEWGKWQQY